MTLRQATRKHYCVYIDWVYLALVGDGRRRRGCSEADFLWDCQPRDRASVLSGLPGCIPASSCRKVEMVWSCLKVAHGCPINQCPFFCERREPTQQVELFRWSSGNTPIISTLRTRLRIPRIIHRCLRVSFQVQVIRHVPVADRGWGSWSRSGLELGLTRTSRRSSCRGKYQAPSQPP